MPAPTNTTAATALALAVGSSVTLSVSDIPSDVTKTLWFRHTSATRQVISVLGWEEAASDYLPNVTVWEGPDAGSLAQTTPFGTGIAQRRLVQITIEAGATLYFRVVDANGGSNPNGTSGQQLVVTLERSDKAALPAGYLLVPDDKEDFPGALINPGTGVTERLIPIVAGENGAVASNGRFLLEDKHQGTFVLYDRHGDVVKVITELTIPGVTFVTWAPITAVGTEFYVMRVESDLTGGPDVYIWHLDNAGTVLDQWSDAYPNAGAPASIAVAPDGSEFYIARIGGAQPVYRFDPDTGTFGAAFLAGASGQIIRTDLIALDDGSVLVGVNQGGIDEKVLRISAAGSLLETYAITGVVPGDDWSRNRMAIGLERDTFWLWLTDQDANGNNIARFAEIDLDDGSLLRTAISWEFQEGLGPVDPEDEDRRFGHSNSCPFVILTQPMEAEADPPPFTFDESLVCPCPCDCHPGPSSGPPPTSTGPIQPPVNIEPVSGPVTPLDPVYWTALCVGGGLVPTAADPTVHENWVRV